MLPRGGGRGPRKKLTAAAAAIYESTPSVEQMRAMGFEPEDFEGDEVEVWPENWPAVQLFGRLGTQWQVSVSGPSGLQYPVLFDLLDRSGYTGPEWWAMFDDIQLMERAALDAMRANT